MAHSQQEITDKPALSFYGGSSINHGHLLLFSPAEQAVVISIFRSVRKLNFSSILLSYLKSFEDFVFHFICSSFML